MASRLAFLTQICGVLKHLPRTGWVYMGIPQCESVADHMYRMALTCFLIQDERVDKNRCIKMALVHDIAEAIVGDIAPGDGISDNDKHSRELAAIEQIEGMLLPETAGSEIRELWEEYENGSTLEAGLVKQIDKLDMIIQAEEYETKHPTIDLEEFFECTQGDFFSHHEIVVMVQELLNQRRNRKGI